MDIVTDKGLITEVGDDFAEFRKRSDVIVAKSWNDVLKNMLDKVF